MALEATTLPKVSLLLVSTNGSSASSNFNGDGISTEKLSPFLITPGASLNEYSPAKFTLASVWSFPWSIFPGNTLSSNVYNKRWFVSCTLFFKSAAFTSFKILLLRIIDINKIGIVSRLIIFLNLLFIFFKKPPIFIFNCQFTKSDYLR